MWDPELYASSHSPLIFVIETSLFGESEQAGPRARSRSRLGRRNHFYGVHFNSSDPRLRNVLSIDADTGTQRLWLHVEHVAVQPNTTQTIHHKSPNMLHQENEDAC